jgi:succinate dehydrogenase/fumarate reductase flavoprotein subunit
MLICDRRFLWKYGLGMIRPLTPVLRPFIKRGYLRVANTLQELAQKIGVDPFGLVSTVNEHNEYAKTGIDEEFDKGGNPYDLSSGDPTHRPNPCLGPIKKAPFFSVAVVPTPLGTSLGLRPNVNGQVCDSSNQPIPGLYTCGNDMHSVMGGEYPGAGVQLGLAMTFGYIIAKHAAR